MIDKSKKEVDLHLRIRSSTESVKSLEEITTKVVELLSKDLQLFLVEKNVSVNRTSDKTLSSITVTLQTE